MQEDRRPPDKRRTILAGDVGGTKTNLGLYDDGPGGLRLTASATFASADFSGLAPVVRAFQRQLAAGPTPETPATLEAPATPTAPTPPATPAIAAACFGVAGPVRDNRASTPNLAWEIDGPALAAELDLPAVELVNDLVATALGIPLLRDDELAVLQAGVDEGGHAGAAGNQALIAAGTGLGMALMPRVDGRRVTVPSEGGHADFSPRDEEGTALLLHLRRRFGEHVSVERVVSGRGLHSIYEYLRDAGGVESPEVAAALAAGDPSRAIAEAALAGRDELCGRAVDLFVDAYGAAAGNLALTCTATGGVYIGGGIAPKLLPRLTGGRFLRAFVDKGRFETYMRSIPVRVILNDRTALLGAARSAAELAATLPASREEAIERA